MARKPRRQGWHDVDKSDIRVSELVQSFLMSQEDRNHSSKTVRWYSDMLGRFAASLPAEARLRDIDTAAIRVYLHGNRQNRASKFTVHAYARTLKTFLRWLHREGYVDEELHRHIQMPKVPSYNDVTIDVLSDEEIAHLLSLLDPSTDVGCRDRAILCLHDVDVLMNSKRPEPRASQRNACKRVAGTICRRRGQDGMTQIFAKLGGVVIAQHASST